MPVQSERDSLTQVDLMSRLLRFLRLSLGGALFTVAAYGTALSLAGVDTSTSGDLVAALLGGGATAVAVKSSLLA